MNFTQDLRGETLVNLEDMFDLANNFISAVKSLDRDKLRLIITRYCIWRGPGRGTTLRARIGSEFVIDELSRIGGQMTDIKLKKVLYKLNGVAISFHFQIIMTGVESMEKFTIVCTLRENLISVISTS